MLFLCPRDLLDNHREICYTADTIPLPCSRCREKGSKQMKRTRILAAALLAVLLMTTTAFASVKSAKDVPTSSWAYKPVSYVLEKGIMETDAQGNFRLQEEMSRGEFVYSLWCAAGRPTPAAASPFQDVSASSRYYKAVSWAAAEKVASGTSATTFSPNTTLTREQAFTFLWKALPVLGLTQGSGGALTVFRDGDTVSSWAQTAVKALYVQGIVTGTNENKLEPKRTVKRGEAASLLYETIGQKQTTAAWSWFDDAVFIGDSVSLKLNYYVTKQRQSDSGYMGTAQFLTSGSLGSGNALWDVSSQSVHPTYQGEKMKLEESIPLTGAKKVYIMLGMNDVGMYGPEKSAENLETLLDKIQAKAPGVSFYVQSATPMCKGAEKKALNNDTLTAYNRLVKELCIRRGWHYVDVASVLQDGEGYLPTAYCSDPQGMGIHFTDTACQVWIDYLRTHTD